MPVSRPIPVSVPAHGVVFAESVHGPGFRMAERADPSFDGRIVKAPQPYAVFPLFLLISRASYARNPARIEAIWRAIGMVPPRPAHRHPHTAAQPHPHDD